MSSLTHVTQGPSPEPDSDSAIKERSNILTERCWCVVTCKLEEATKTEQWRCSIQCPHSSFATLPQTKLYTLGMLSVKASSFYKLKCQASRVGNGRTLMSMVTSPRIFVFIGCRVFVTTCGKQKKNGVRCYAKDTRTLKDANDWVAYRYCKGRGLLK